MPAKKPRKRERVPFGGRRQRLKTEQRTGFVRRWFNDTEDRIQRALDAGYTFVKDDVSVGQGQIGEENTDMNGSVSKIVSKGGGEPVRAYLMEIPENFYLQDQAEKEKINRMVDDAIRAGTPSGANVEHGYIPRDGIKHEHR